MTQVAHQEWGLPNLDFAKSSRKRKQSKPSRVSENAVKLEEERNNAAAAAAAAATADAAPISVSSFACQLCESIFDSQTLLNDHIRNQHEIPRQRKVSQSLDDADDAEENEKPQAKQQQLASSFPTKYHQLGSEINQQAFDMVEPMEEETTTTADGDEELEDTLHPEEGQEVTEGKIFNKEAYCERCRREFCNKYFLKTHLATRHGILDSIETSPPAAPSEVSEKTSPEPEQISNLPPLPPPAPSLVGLPPPTTPPSPKDEPKSVPKDMEDYCDICQKHFCNKYYLRKHKQDVHGIIPETPPSYHKRSRSVTTNASPKNSNVPTSLIPPSNGLNPPPSGQSFPPGLSPNLMFINPFASPVALLPGQPLPFQTQTGLPSLSGIPPQLSTDFKFSTASTSTVSTPKPSIPNDALRSMGVLNADAYCEICRKEFCNKYFLKIHKANKHGIYVDDLVGNRSGNHFDAPSPEMLHSFMQAAQQLNGMNGEMELGEKKTSTTVTTTTTATTTATSSSSAVSTTSSATPPLTTATDDYCEYCKKEFSNKYNLKVHLINVHGIKPSEKKEDEMTDQQQPTHLANTMLGNMIAARNAERVICDICNKDVCNKYFLRTHKLKVHGVETPSDSPSPKKDESSTPTLILNPQKNNNNNIEQAIDVQKEEAGANLPKPGDDELLKMGIDPEAYCEICKKEFCSKYFLKTHKLKIHGIGEKKEECSKSRCSPPPSQPPTSTTTSRQSSPLNVPNLANISALSHLSASATATPPGLLSQEMCMSPFDPLSILNGGENNQWKWKEPLHSQRVMCELCQKEVCNKYFLRTHMQNKHGITIEEYVSYMIKKEKGAVGSSQPDIQPPPPSSLATSLPLNLMSDNKLSLPAFVQSDAMMRKCQMCGHVFTSQVALQLHVMRDHTQNKSESIGDSNDEDAGPPKKAKVETDDWRSESEEASSQISSKSTKKKKFRCVHCSQKFPTRALCQQHISKSLILIPI